MGLVPCSVSGECLRQLHNEHQSQRGNAIHIMCNHWHAHMLPSVSADTRTWRHVDVPPAGKQALAQLWDTSVHLFPASWQLPLPAPAQLAGYPGLSYARAP